MASPGAQVHLAPRHDCPFPHTTAQLPQFFESDFKSTHAPAHAVRPAPQLGSHLPELQLGAASVQATSQPPQCFGSALESTHRPAHEMVPAGHAHVPPVHNWSSAHAL